MDGDNRLTALARAVSAHRLLAAKARDEEAAARALEAQLRALPAGPAGTPVRICLCAGVETELSVEVARSVLAPAAARARAAADAAAAAAGADAAPNWLDRIISTDPCR